MLRDGNVDGVLKLLTDSLERGVREHFERARVAKDFDKNDWMRAELREGLR